MTTDLEWKSTKNASGGFEVFIQNIQIARVYQQCVRMGDVAKWVIVPCVGESEIAETLDAAKVRVRSLVSDNCQRLMTLLLP